MKIDFKPSKSLLAKNESKHASYVLFLFWCPIYLTIFTLKFKWYNLLCFISSRILFGLISKFGSNIS